MTDLMGPFNTFSTSSDASIKASRFTSRFQYVYNCITIVYNCLVHTIFFSCWYTVNHCNVSHTRKNHSPVFTTIHRNGVSEDLLWWPPNWEGRPGDAGWGHGPMVEERAALGNWLVESQKYYGQHFLRVFCMIALISSFDLFWSSRIFGNRQFDGGDARKVGHMRLFQKWFKEQWNSWARSHAPAPRLETSASAQQDPTCPIMSYHVLSYVYIQHHSIFHGPKKV